MENGMETVQRGTPWGNGNESPSTSLEYINFYHTSEQSTVSFRVSMENILLIPHPRKNSNNISLLFVSPCLASCKMAPVSATEE